MMATDASLPSWEEETKRWRRRRVLGYLAVPLVIVAIIAALILPQVVIQTVNDAGARDVETRLQELPHPVGAEVVDSLSLAGKLSGNGNGMQYLGALLIRSDQTVDALQSFYDRQDAGGLSITVTGLTGLSGLHKTPGFLGAASEPGTFIVFAWGDGPGELFRDFDLRGH